MTRQIVLTVHARGSVDACERAKAMARSQGHRVRTIASCGLVLGQVGDERRDEMAWTVALAVSA
jgi:hypothetical protein